MRECENIQELVKLSPDYIGFIFYDKSKRFVADFPNIAIPSTIKKAGIFVNESIDNIADLVTKNIFDVVQLHGDESVEFCKELMKKFNHQTEIIKAFSVDENFDFGNTKDYESVCDLFIFDTKGNGYGGTGLKYDWSILNNYKGEVHFLLSGGITPNDVEVVREFKHNKCIGVDLNSGFEDAPGVKNIEKLKEFIAEIN